MSGNDLSVVLDANTVEAVERLAKTWGVSKGEAVRRAVKQAQAASLGARKPDRLEAFEELQRRLQLTPEKAAAWQAEVRESRR